MISRRVLLVSGGLLVSATAGATGYKWFNPEYHGGELTVREAYEAATDQNITLIDIRRPDEWAKTGIGAPAHPIDMRRDDFVAALENIVGTDRTKPVALICARGVRSARLSNRLEQAGFTNIINVPEGMLGSRAGPGWLGSKLPVRQP